MREYKNMYDAYTRIFTRCGLAFRAVEADTGAIGGSQSHEFQVLTETGEDAILACDKCDYAANVEEAKARPAASAPRAGGTGPRRRESGNPGQAHHRGGLRLLGLSPQDLVKTLIYWRTASRWRCWCAGIGRRTTSRSSARSAAPTWFWPPTKAVEEVTSAPVGFAGPVGLRIPIYCDHEVCGLGSFICGANAADLHLANVVSQRDFAPTECGDFRAVAAGDACPRCEHGPFHQLPRHRSRPGVLPGDQVLGAHEVQVPRRRGQRRTPMVMGCYGIGVTRIAAAAIEQNHDTDGIIWPVPIAPFEVAVLDLQQDDPNVVATATRIYDQLTMAGIEVLYDDRNERAGVRQFDRGAECVEVGRPEDALHARGLGRAIAAFAQVHTPRRQQAEAGRFALGKALRVTTSPSQRARRGR